MKSTVEKLPKPLMVVAREARSLNSGTENFMFSSPRARSAWCDQAIRRVAVHQRPQQDAADNTEYGGVGADADTPSVTTTVAVSPAGRAQGDVHLAAEQGRGVDPAADATRAASTRAAGM